MINFESKYLLPVQTFLNVYIVALLYIKISIDDLAIYPKQSATWQLGKLWKFTNRQSGDKDSTLCILGTYTFTYAQLHTKRINSKGIISKLSSPIYCFFHLPAARVSHLSSGLQFIRAEGFVFSHVADEGFMDACAGDLMRYRKSIDANDVAVYNDIKKKHRYVQSSKWLMGAMSFRKQMKQ